MTHQQVGKWLDRARRLRGSCPGGAKSALCGVVACLNVIPFIGMVYPAGLHRGILPEGVLAAMSHADAVRIVNSYGLFSAMVGATLFEPCLNPV